MNEGGSIIHSFGNKQLEQNVTREKDFVSCSISC